MAGIYIHIPFCKQACYYCDFHFSTSLKNKSALVEAILLELNQRKEYLNNEIIETIYFGGGTPSLLDINEIQSILSEIGKLFQISSTVEITLEANPDDLKISKIKELKASGINRLSIGIQSFFDEDLKYMNRAHNAEEANIVINNCLEEGFKDLSIDLIYGGSTLSDENWQKNIEKALNSGINHLSAYCLTVEDKTALSNFILKGKYKPLDEEKSIRHFEMLKKMVKDYGFEQYEISNFSKSKNYSKHNTNYWKAAKYLGVGPSAHSFDGISRQWNIRNNAQYIKGVNEDVTYYEMEILKESDRFNEYLMTALRTKWGVNYEYIQKNFDEKYIHSIGKQLNHIESFVTKNKVGFQLNSMGMNIADKVISELFYLDESSYS